MWRVHNLAHSITVLTGIGLVVYLVDDYVSYELNAYTDKPRLMVRTYSELHQNVQDKFAEAGVEIMSPRYSAIRDGNQVALPADRLPKGYTAPAFRVTASPNLETQP